MKVKELADFLNARKLTRIYLIHEPEREKETRIFAATLKQLGFQPLIAADYRKHGEHTVSMAIAISQFSLVLAFDEKTIKNCENQGVPYFDVEVS